MKFTFLSIMWTGFIAGVCCSILAYLQVKNYISYFEYIVPALLIGLLLIIYCIKGLKQFEYSRSEDYQNE